VRARTISGSTVVVVGATSGVGRATALSLAANGARLVVAARDETALDEVVAGCRALGAHAEAVSADIGDDHDIEEIVAVAVRRFGRIDTWINTASVLSVGDLVDLPTDDIIQLVGTNVTGTTLASRAALSHFRVNGDGVLINVSSLLGLVPNPVVPTYAMSKFAIRGLSLCLWEATRGTPIRVCTVMPGPIDTAMFQRASNWSGRGIRAIPPAASPERVAAAIVRSVRRPRRQRTVGALGALIVAGHHVAPRTVETAVAQASARLVFRGGRHAPTPAAPPGAVADDTSGGWRRFVWRVRLGDSLGRYLARR
jgi:short-subunit dehydrogenase